MSGKLSLTVVPSGGLQAGLPRQRGDERELSVVVELPPSEIASLTSEANPMRVRFTPPGDTETYVVSFGGDIVEVAAIGDGDGESQGWVKVKVPGAEDFQALNITVSTETKAGPAPRQIEESGEPEVTSALPEDGNGGEESVEDEALYEDEPMVEQGDEGEMVGVLEDEDLYEDERMYLEEDDEAPYPEAPISPQESDDGEPSVHGGESFHPDDSTPPQGPDREGSGGYGGERFHQGEPTFPHGDGEREQGPEGTALHALSAGASRNSLRSEPGQFSRSIQAIRDLCASVTSERFDDPR